MIRDLRESGVGYGDVVDVVVRGRITTIGQISVRLAVTADPTLAPVGVTEILIYIPVESVVSLVLADETSGQ